VLEKKMTAAEKASETSNNETRTTRLRKFGRITMIANTQEATLLNPSRDLRVSLRDAIESAAEARLRRSAYPEVGRVRCELHGGTLILWGRVSTFFLKQVAQAVVRGVEGVVDVDNQLEVVPPQPRRRPDDLTPAEHAARGRRPR
jgi:osmotically-inducible protein OsmY